MHIEHAGEKYRPLIRGGGRDAIQGKESHGMPLLFLQMFYALGHGSRVFNYNRFQVIFHNNSHGKLVSLLPHLLHSTKSVRAWADNGM